MAKNDFFAAPNSNSLNLAVAFDEPLERLRKLVKLLRSQLPQRAQREIDDRQMRVREAATETSGLQRNDFPLNSRINAFGQFRRVA